jgi:septal ring factor EnvC (AmiA/AmiB activator)
LIRKRAQQIIDESIIGTVYIPSAIAKLVEIKAFTLFTLTELNSKKEGHDKTQTDIEECERNIRDAEHSIECAEKEIQEMERQLGFWNMKKQHYVGEHRLVEVNKQLRDFNRKRLEK